MDLSKYLASWRSYYSHVDRGGAVCAGIACLAIIPIILLAGHGCLTALLLVAVIVAFPVALYDGDFVGNSAARPEPLTSVLSERYGLREGTLTCASGRNQQVVDLRVGRNGMTDADYECTARTTKGEWVGWTLVVRDPKVGFFDEKGKPVRPVGSR